MNEKLDQLGDAITAIQRQIALQFGEKNQSSTSSVTPAKPSVADLKVTCVCVTEVVETKLEVVVDENEKFIKKFQLVPKDMQLLGEETNEAAVEKDSTDISTIKSLIHQTQKVFDKMSERESELWNEDKCHFLDHVGELECLDDDFGENICDISSIKHLILKKLLSRKISYKENKSDRKLPKSLFQLVLFESEGALRVKQTNSTLKILQRFKVLLDIEKARENLVMFSKIESTIGQSHVWKILDEMEHIVAGAKRSNMDHIDSLEDLEFDINGKMHKVASRDWMNDKLIYHLDLYKDESVSGDIQTELESLDYLIEAGEKRSPKTDVDSVMTKALFTTLSLLGSMVLDNWVETGNEVTRIEVPKSYISKVVCCTLLANDISLNNVENAEHLFNGMKRLFSGQSRDISWMENIGEKMNPEGMILNMKVQVSFIPHYIADKLNDKAKAAIFDKLLKIMEKPSLRHYAALIDVDARHGVLTKGKALPRRMTGIGVVMPVAWDVIVKLYANSGEVNPDEVAFTIVPVKCRHSKMVGKGKHLFQRKKENPVESNVDYHVCVVVDLPGASLRPPQFQHTSLGDKTLSREEYCYEHMYAIMNSVLISFSWA
ncbi:hypothetical protein C2S51_028853 [Perilla frutescens var. frutescens]|nr:hypothetical protein C2S51_028853 [Perilla frutescens var. frutescens]